MPRPLQDTCQHCHTTYTELYNDGSLAVGYCNHCGHFTGYRKPNVPLGYAQIIKRQVADSFSFESLEAGLVGGVA